MHLAALRARIAAKELEIALQRQILSESEASLGELNLELFRLSTYPTLSLPPELLSEIFIHCLPAAGVDSSSTNDTQAPLLLTQVCKTWKRVALSTPQLWTALNCNFDSESWADRGSSMPLRFG
uniref:F-box domain-containing protein n=1 Tax=Mycena chlorophos TaxID=658473 RepID=A0ABQ0M1L9_MYCCL|nr:predicted protein [Mycena chlorophos]